MDQLTLFGIALLVVGFFFMGALIGYSIRIIQEEKEW